MVALPEIIAPPTRLTHPERQVVALAIAVNAVLALVLVYLQVVVGIHTRELVQEPVYLAHLPVWTGAYSYLSVLLFTAGAAVALFAAVLLAPGSQGRAFRPALLVAGAYFAFAATDDLFLLHDNGFFVGLPEVAALAVHAVLLGVFVLALAPVWQATPWPVAVLAFGALAVSTVLDVLKDRFTGQGISEEVVETTGMTLLVAYVVLVAVRALTSSPKRRRA